VLPPFPKPARIQNIWMTPVELEDMVIAKTGIPGGCAPGGAIATG